MNEIFGVEWGRVIIVSKIQEKRRFGGRGGRGGGRAGGGGSGGDLSLVGFVSLLASFVFVSFPFIPSFLLFSIFFLPPFSFLD